MFGLLCVWCFEGREEWTVQFYYTSGYSCFILSLPVVCLFVCSQTLCGICGVVFNILKDHSAFCLQDQAEFLDCITLKMKAPWTFVMSGAACTVTQCYITEGLNIYNSAVRTTNLTTTRAVGKVSSRIEYLMNRSHDLDITWQPVGGDLTVHPWTVTVPWG